MSKKNVIQPIQPDAPAGNLPILINCFGSGFGIQHQIGTANDTNAIRIRPKGVLENTAMVLWLFDDDYDN